MFLQIPALWITEIFLNSIPCSYSPMFRFLLNANSTLLRIFSFRPLSSATATSTVDYLTNTLGFARESAVAVAEELNIKTTTRPDLVVQLFKSYGFTPTHIATIVSKHPSLLLADPVKTLAPKLQFFSNNGVSGSALVHIVSADPVILRRSLQNQIIPCISFLKKVLPTDHKIASLLTAKRGTWVVHKFSEKMVPNIETLRSHGVPESNILRMLILRPRTLSFNTGAFKGILKRVKEMGFDENGLMFIHGVCTLCGMKKAKWESKVSVFRSFGWGEEEVIALFVKQPKFMNSSEARIRKSLDFFMNELHWMPEDISKYPIVLFLSFEKRVVPRSRVLQLLIEKGLVTRRSMGRALIIPEDQFLKVFMSSYEKKIPELWEIYQSNKVGLPQSAVSVWGGLAATI